jgi:hypothetical protein
MGGGAPAGRGNVAPEAISSVPLCFRLFDDSFSSPSPEAGRDPDPDLDPVRPSEV